VLGRKRDISSTLNLISFSAIPQPVRTLSERASSLWRGHFDEVYVILPNLVAALRQPQDVGACTLVLPYSTSSKRDPQNQPVLCFGASMAHECKPANQSASGSSSTSSATDSGASACSSSLSDADRDFLVRAGAFSKHSPAELEAAYRQMKAGAIDYLRRERRSA
jgi:hypothetical protein